MFYGSTHPKSDGQGALYFTISSNRLKLSHIEQKKFLPDLCEKNPDASADLVSDKAKDRVNTNLFQATKLRSIALCNSCNASRCIFSSSGIGSGNGLLQGDLVELQEKIEYAYLCGDSISVEAFLIKQQHRCEEYVESWYYYPVTGLRGGRIKTKENFAVCYDENDLMQHSEIERSSRYTGGEIPLPVCTGCFNLGVKLPTSGGRISKKVSAQNEKANKK